MSHATFRFFVCLIIAVTIPGRLFSCTIFCGKDSHGQMWAGNNEDFYWFYFSTQLRVVAETDSTLSFVYFNYKGHDFPQGGVNEAGLFFDGNMVEASEIKDADKKMPLPGDTKDLVLHMLGRCKTVPEVLALFAKYKIDDLRTAQVHLADREGNMGIIAADSSWMTSGNFQVSTNYNLSHDDDDYKTCWRYPIAYSMLKASNPGFQLMTQICDSTSQRRGVSTIYSNVHNLTTGEMWLYYGWDYERPYKTTFDELVALGDTVIMMRDLFPHQPLVQAYHGFRTTGFHKGLKVLNTISDRELRQEKLKLLSQGALFDFGEFVRSEKVAITTDEQLIGEIIEASSDYDILTVLASQDVSETNKELAEGKLAAMEAASISNTSILSIIMTGGLIAFFIFAIRIIARRDP